MTNLKRTSPQKERSSLQIERFKENQHSYTYGTSEQRKCNCPLFPKGLHKQNACEYSYRSRCQKELLQVKQAIRLLAMSVSVMIRQGIQKRLRGQKRVSQSLRQRANQLIAVTSEIGALKRLLIKKKWNHIEGSSANSRNNVDYPHQICLIITLKTNSSQNSKILTLVFHILKLFFH